MPNYRKIFVLEHGALAVIRDAAGNTVTFESLADLNRCTGMNFAGKFYIGYEPDIEFFQDSEDPTVTAAAIPHAGYEWLISNVQILALRKADPLYGLSGAALFEAQKRVDEAAVRATFDIEANAPVQALGFTWKGGEGSAGAINGAVGLAQALGENEVHITDIDNVKHTMSFADTIAVAAQIGKAWRDAFFKKQAALVEIANRQMPQ